MIKTLGCTKCTGADKKRSYFFRKLPVLIIATLIGLSGCNTNDQKKEYSSDGKLLSTYYEDSNGEYHGIFSTYYPNGRIKEKAIYRHGKLHGVYIKYQEDGTIKTKGHYRNGKESGEFLTYVNGIIFQSQYYDDFGQEIKNISYDQQGNVMVKRFLYVGSGNVSSYVEYESNKINEKKSSFITITRSGDSHNIHFHDGLLDEADSLKVYYLRKFSNHREKRFNEEDVIESESYQLNAKDIKLKIKDLANKGGMCNIIFQLYGSQPGIDVLIVDFPLQFKPSRDIPKNNLLPIYFNK